ncbi:hypothetical protein WA158_006587 [Blastocystis sp. Blastoise]
MASLFSGLSGLTDKITSFIREPVSSLGNAINDAINASYGTVSSDKYLKFADMVNSTNDPEILEEVWFVLAKGIGNSVNSCVRTTMQICDTLMKNTGAKFHNSCTPLFMRRCKEMIVDRSQTGGADNMHIANDCKAMIRRWGDAFMPYASSGRGRTIVEGYQDMQRDGIRFAPAPSSEEKWEPPVNPPRRIESSYSNNYASSPSYKSSSSSSSSSYAEPSSPFDPKETYRLLKKVLAKQEDEGNDVFENEKIKTFVEETIGNTKRLQRLIERETTSGGNENYLSRLLTLNDMIQQITSLYKSYKNSKTKKVSDDWSDKDDDDWSDDDKPMKKPAKKAISRKNDAISSNEGPSIRSTGRRLKNETASTSKNSKAADSLFDSDDDIAVSTKKPVKKSNNSLFDSDDEEDVRQSRQPKANKNASWDDDDDEWTTRKADNKKKSNTTSRMNKKAANSLFDDDDDNNDDEFKPEVKPSKKPTTTKPKKVEDDLLGLDFFGNTSSSAATTSEPMDLMDETDLSTLDFTSAPTNSAPVNKAEPVKTKVNKTKKSAFDDLFEL